ncbi:tetratricopeptide repeat protein [Acidipila sp. EB88]|uniref:tetratricopeptide repeat protein n=1 Tax=Acidipila sp. EB88 TaxID=2305226 RepID=UPI000F5F2258|nr:tetratricopeptide repeat protein [Acidipila sp. EB88]RRA47491.1 tetratricopeptide repeat protein [Acidipila sp. EB88]
MPRLAFHSTSPASGRLSRALLLLALFAAAGWLGTSRLPLLLQPEAVVKAESTADVAQETRHQFSARVDATYHYLYGKDHPFLPSNATTDTGEFIDPKTVPTAAYCGHCHQESHKEWRESAHSNSNRAPWYLRNVNLLTDQKGVGFTRHCEGCHDPVATMAGALTEGKPLKRPYDQDGVTCMVCHSIQKVDTRGTGSYVMGVPAVLMDENGAPIQRPVTDAEILAHLDRHSAAVMRPLYRTSEFCASCHKAALPQTLNGYKWQRAISLYDEWQNSSFAKQSPLPFYVKDSVSNCQTCHMQRDPLQGVDYGAKHGTLASHRWLGANTVVPQYYKYPDQAEAVLRFLRNNVFNIDLFGLETAPTQSASTSSPMIAPLGLANYQLTPGQYAVLSVVIQNKGIAHSHVPEQRDMYESWVEFTLRDAHGKLIASSGSIRPNEDLDPAAHSFTNRLINKQGELNGHHEVWNNRVVAYNNTIQSGRSQIVRYGFTLPAQMEGGITATATVRYRRFNQHFMDFGMKEPADRHYEQQTVDMVSASRTFYPGANKAATPGPDENKEWMRWNNYGVGLLDAQQYAASVAAFQHVAKLRPDYPDALTNIAIADIQWERYADALPNLKKALQLAPADSTPKARALYYLALVERNEGNMDQSITDLLAVAAQFPRSRDAHRELGFCYYQQHKYEQARTEYEAVQAIDPDDLAAHYNLAIIYRRTGLKDKAQEQAAYFADKKDDPTASVYALEYLSKHSEVAQESVPWHVHDLDHNGATIADPAARPTSFSATMQ